MDPMSGFDICLMFTLPPRDSILQYKKCIHLSNNFPCIITLDATVNNQFNLNYFMCSSLLSLRKILNKPWNMFNQKMNIYRVEGSSLKSDPMRVLGNPLYKLFLNYKKRKDFYPIISPVIDRVAHSTPRLQNT